MRAKRVCVYVLWGGLRSHFTTSKYSLFGVQHQTMLSLASPPTAQIASSLQRLCKHKVSTIIMIQNEYPLSTRCRVQSAGPAGLSGFMRHTFTSWSRLAGVTSPYGGDGPTNYNSAVLLTHKTAIWQPCII